MPVDTRLATLCTTLFLTLSALGLQVTDAWAQPSFDCARAESSAEKLVCDNEELARLDRRLAEVYATALGRWPEEEVATQKALQRGWIKGRDDCWKEEDLLECVSFAYRSRIAEIQIQSGQLEVPSPVLYVCLEDERNPFYVTYYQQTDPPSAVVTWDRQQVILFIARSGSGARYTAPGVELWEHQGEATVDFFGSKLKCKVR